MAFRLTAQIVRTVAGDPNPTSTPVCEESFKRICTSVDCDIVSMDLTQQLAYRLNQKHVEAAAKRGLVFEIVYSKLFLDATIRRNVFTNARALCRALPPRDGSEDREWGASSCPCPGLHLSSGRRRASSRQPSGE